MWFTASSDAQRSRALGSAYSAALTGLLTATLLAGCASGPAFVAPQAPAPDSAVLYVYRTSSILGAGIKHALMLDGRPLGKLVNGSHMRIEVKTKERIASLASFECASPKQTLVLRPGKTAYVQLALINKTVTVGGRHLFDYGCEMLLRSEDDALPVLTGLPRAD